jgi:hypothetical protein
VGPLQGSRSGERGRAELTTRRGSCADPAPGGRQGGTNASGTAEHDMLIRVSRQQRARCWRTFPRRVKKIRWVARDHSESPIPPWRPDLDHPGRPLRAHAMAAGEPLNKVLGGVVTGWPLQGHVRRAPRTTAGTLPGHCRDTGMSTCKALGHRLGHDARTLSSDINTAQRIQHPRAPGGRRTTLWCRRSTATRHTRKGLPVGAPLRAVGGP